MMRWLGPLLLAAAAAAQSVPQAPGLYDCWLRELLDCDSRGAAVALSQLSIDTQTPPAERWLATARLLELRRIGIEPGLPSARLDEAPPQLQQELQKRAVEREDVQGLLELARSGNADLLAAVRAAQSRSNYRPLVPEVVRWAIAQATHGESRRELRQQMELAWRTRDMARWVEARRKLLLLSQQPSLLQREHALQILVRVLEGRGVEAERLRRDYFPDWQPPRLTNEPATLLERALANFPRLRTDARDEEQEALEKLEQAMRRQGAQDPAGALHQLDRLPFYAEQLLR